MHPGEVHFLPRKFYGWKSSRGCSLLKGGRGGTNRVGPNPIVPDRLECYWFSLPAKKTNSANNTMYYLKLDKQRRKSSQRNCHMISQVPSVPVAIKAIIIITMLLLMPRCFVVIYIYMYLYPYIFIITYISISSIYSHIYITNYLHLFLIYIDLYLIYISKDLYIDMYINVCTYVSSQVIWVPPSLSNHHFKGGRI